MKVVYTGIHKGTTEITHFIYDLYRDTLEKGIVYEAEISESQNSYIISKPGYGTLYYSIEYFITVDELRDKKLNELL